MATATAATLVDAGMAWLQILFDRDNRKQTGITIGAASAVVYLALVRYLRYRNINAIKEKYPDPTLALRDSAVAEEVYNTTLRKEFPFLARTSLEFALFKTYSVPTISKILYATGEFSRSIDSTRKRADDTELILFEIAEAYPHIEELKKGNRVPTQEEINDQRRRPEIATKRLNELHGKYPILNGDYLYTLSLFIVEPIKWINNFEWRNLEPIEMNAIFRVWYDIGKGMNIQDIPTTLEGMYEFHEQYARENVRYAPSNWKVGHPTVEHLLTRYPKFASPLAYKLVPAILDPIDVVGFGLEQPKAWAKRVIDITFFLRSMFLRHLALPRSQPMTRTPLKPDAETNLYKPRYDLYEPTYPNGYCIYELGPDKSRPKKCPVPH
ncbi:hypothetical protein BDB00DRAFT_272599 [Zychaea mexicana]|uniref:uncharacterized protein n=1 Tax=Zychaea mexicana TaxID=64656 RepID=UPI0022FDFF6D|nr:uncharacterized protein BDB00DRAFT_272599 [Zychaea mexicana]KAI9495130.1 hypothetical protein BDB00DRAFT_272599 [Zychaea mexicana]